MKILDRYIDQLLEKSSPQAPIWNIEKIRQGAKPSWNYIDGCMIKAILELYHIKKNPAYLEFARMHLSIILYVKTVPSFPMTRRNIIWTMSMPARPYLTYIN